MAAEQQVVGIPRGESKIPIQQVQGTNTTDQMSETSDLVTSRRTSEKEPDITKGIALKAHALWYSC